MVPLFVLIHWFTAETRAAEGEESTCDLSGPLDAPFTVPVQGQHVNVILEIWMRGADIAWAQAVLDAIESRGLPAMVVLPLAAPSDALIPLLAHVRDSASDFAVVLPTSLVPRTKDDSLRPLRDALEPLEAHTGQLQTAIAEVGSRQREGMLARVGFRSFIDLRTPPGSEPRMAGSFEGQPRTRVVLPPGLYDDLCASSPLVTPFSPRAADRAAVAIQHAARSRKSPTVRVALDGRSGSPEDAVVLGRWLDGMVKPGGVQVVTAEKARKLALIAFNKPPAALPEAEIGGRLVSIDSLRDSAAALTSPPLLPRQLDSGLNPTEAFFGFVLLLADHTEGPVVRLGAMRGPASEANTSLRGPTEISADAIREAAISLVGVLPNEVPAALSVDGQLLTAGEFLLAMAGVVRGEEIVRVGPVADPEPNERGLGWGLSTLP